MIFFVKKYFVKVDKVYTLYLGEEQLLLFFKRYSTYFSEEGPKMICDSLLKKIYFSITYLNNVCHHYLADSLNKGPVIKKRYKIVLLN